MCWPDRHHAGINQVGRVRLWEIDPAVAGFLTSTSFGLTGDSSTGWFHSSPLTSLSAFSFQHDCTFQCFLSGLGQGYLHSCVVSDLGLGPLYAGSYTPGQGEGYSRVSEMRGYRYHLQTLCMGNFIASFASAGTFNSICKGLGHQEIAIYTPTPEGSWLTYTSWTAEPTFWKREFWL